MSGNRPWRCLWPRFCTACLGERAEPAADFVGSAEALTPWTKGWLNFHLWFLANLSCLLGFARQRLIRRGRGSTSARAVQRRAACAPGSDDAGVRLVARPMLSRRAASGRRGLNRDRRSEFQCHAGSISLPPRRHQRRAVGAHTKRGVLTLNSKDKRKKIMRKMLLVAAALAVAFAAGPGAEIRFQARLDPYFGLHASIRWRTCRRGNLTTRRWPRVRTKPTVSMTSVVVIQKENLLAHHRHRQQYAASGSAFQPLERSGLN